MARISGVVVPDNKRVRIALRYITGIGPTRANDICDTLKFPIGIRISELKEEDLNAISFEIDKKKYLIEGYLRRKVRDDIKALTSIKCYRGIRHIRSLPVRGQRTHSNARTRKGKRASGGGSK